MDLGEHETAQIDARRAEGARQSQEKSECRPHQGRPPSDLLEDAFVEQIEELGNGHQGGHARLVHAGQKIRALERGREGDPGAGEEQDQLDGEGKGVVEGQDRQQVILGVNQSEFQDALGIGQEVPMAQHDPLGDAGGAGGVQDRGQGAFFDPRQRHLGECRIVQRPAEGERPLAVAVGIQIYHHGEEGVVGAYGEEARDLRPRADGHPAPGVSENVAHLGVAELHVQRDGRPARRGDGEVSHGPLRPILADQGHTVPVGQARPDQRAGQQPRLSDQLAVRQRAVSRRVLDLQGQPVRLPRSDRSEPLEEIRGVPCGLRHAPFPR